MSRPSSTTCAMCNVQNRNGPDMLDILILLSYEAIFAARESHKGVSGRFNIDSDSDTDTDTDRDSKSGSGARYASFKDESV
jgi:hypothetical protein